MSGGNVRRGWYVDVRFFAGFVEEGFLDSVSDVHDFLLAIL